MKKKLIQFKLQFTVQDVKTPYIILTNRLPEVHLNYSSTSRPHPSVRKLPKSSRSTGLLAIFRSLSTRNLDLWYDDESGGEYSYQGSLIPGEVTSITAYEQNMFVVTPVDSPTEIISRIRILPNKV